MKYIENYIYDKDYIGKGTFSKVYIGFEKNAPKKKYAIKKIYRKSNKKYVKYLNLEIEIMNKLNHKNIIKLYDTIYTEKYVFLVLELCDTDLYTYIHNNIITEKETQYIVKQIIEAIKYIMDNNIVHRDLKPHNILINEDTKEIKLCDFGFAREFKDTLLTDTICGSPLYMAPEILHYKKYTQLADLWSVGVILYEILFKVTPIKGNNLYELVSNIKKYNYKNDPLLLNQSIWSEPVIKLIKQLLEKNPKKRITWELFFNHEWFNYKINETQEINKQDDYIFLMDEDNSVIYNSKLTISDNYLDTQLSLSDEKHDSQYLIVSNTKKISSIPRSMPKNRFTNMITSLGNSLSLLFTSPNSI